MTRGVAQGTGEGGGGKFGKLHFGATCLLSPRLSPSIPHSVSLLVSSLCLCVAIKNAFAAFAICNFTLCRRRCPHLPHFHAHFHAPISISLFIQLFLITMALPAPVSSSSSSPGTFLTCCEFLFVSYCSFLILSSASASLMNI